MPPQGGGRLADLAIRLDGDPALTDDRLLVAFSSSRPVDPWPLGNCLAVLWRPGRGNSGSEYIAAARVVDHAPGPKPNRHTLTIADVVRFDLAVPVFGRILHETVLRDRNWRSYAQRAARHLPREEALSILEASAFSPATTQAFEEDQAPFESVRPRRVLTINALLRSVAARDATRAAYANRCIVDGLALKAQDGRPGTEWSHWRPIAAGGPDTTANTSMASPTVHRLIETGLLGLDEQYRFLARGDAIIYLSRNSPERLPILPTDRSTWPSQTFLHWHRRKHALDQFGEVFGR